MFLEEIRRSKKMIIRKAEEKDIPRIIELLGQVLQIHADIRPDIFIPGTRCGTGRAAMRARMSAMPVWE